MLKQASLAVALRVCSALLSLAVVSLAIGAYESEGSAHVLLYISFVNFAAILVRLGLDVYVLKLATTTYRFRTRQLLAGTLGMATVQFAALALPFVFLLRLWGVDTGAAVSMTVGLYFFSILFANGIFFQAAGRIGWMLACQSFAVYLPVVALILLRVEPERVPAVHAASSALFFLLTGWRLDRHALTGAWGGLGRLRTLLRRLYVRSADLLVTALANSFGNWGLLFCLPLVLSATEFEVFAFGQRLAMSASFLIGALEVVASPRIAQLYHGTRIGELRALLVRVRAAAAASAALGLAVVVAALDLMLDYLSLPTDRAHVAVYANYLARAVAAGLGPVGILLVMMGEYAHLRAVTAATSVLMLATTLAAGHLWAAAGASVAFMVVFVLQKVLLFRRSEQGLRRVAK